MKKIILNILLAIIAVSCFSVGIVDADNKTERIVKLSEQSFQLEALSGVVGNYHTVIQVFHDRDSGVEFICSSHVVNTISCFPTGRKW